MVKISISEVKGFDRVMSALDKIETNRAANKEKADKVAEEVAKVGVWAASNGFTAATKERGQIKCDAIKTRGGWKVVADGDEVAFIEFGAGVYFNGFGCYPIPRPYGIVTIGEYGKHQGLNDGWWYKDAEGKPHYTHGIPCAMPMYKALKQMIEAASEAAEKEFAK